MVPLVRHRWEQDHPEVVAVFERSRDVRLTIDARLQYRVAAILARAVRSAGVKRGAAVVVDATTGELLASASFPRPEARATVVGPDDVFDRARYGLYPPGSTFKLVTAAAALRTDPSLAGLSLVCSRLPADRVGVRLPGWGRAVRDDVRDRTAHGAIAMHDGLVRSCNAYFAQLAVHLGVETLAETSSLAGIALSSTTDPAELRNNLPHAGYGQGQVVTTPLRMARVAAAIGSDGVIREMPVVQGAVGGVTTDFVSPDSARTLAGFMRDAVTDGTGRSLARHPVRIAGKTGTAEIDGAASHAWFVGFAPHGEASRRVAFAVVLENAGYGGTSAAAAAGEIVTAAASIGLVR
jgi:cell division protein FtsI/penicillin-binding protein 2